MKARLHSIRAGIVITLIFLAMNGFSEGKIRFMDPPMNPPVLPVPTITTTLVSIPGGITAGTTFTTEAGMTNYFWTTSIAGSIAGGQGTNVLTVDWINPTGNQSVTVTYTDTYGNNPLAPTSYVVLYYPFPDPIDPTIIPQFVDPMPHFAGGLRVNAKAGGNLLIKAVPVQQVALSTGTVLPSGTVGTPGVGLGNYQAYAISTDNGATFGPAMWPAQTIEASQGHPLVVQYRNDLFNNTYADFNIEVDQTLMHNGFPQTGNQWTDPYTGPIPMVTHLHGGEIPSNSDGGPTAWFFPNYSFFGPGFAHDASSVCTYPNLQEGTTLWYHPHDEGLTRINVYCGLAGFYFLRGKNEDALNLPGWSGDDLVQEVTPAGKSATFYPSTPYLPEVEIAVQDRMYNINGGLYWPVTPTNPAQHPFWTPEFFGDIFTVNGKTWPYLSVAPRKYAFRFLDGCNARFLNMWLTSDPTLGVNSPKDGPVITRISTEGGFLESPVVLDPKLNQTLFLAPAERPTIIIDFTGYAPGTVFTLMNDAVAPYPSGDPVIPGLTDRIMQFVVNGTMVSNNNTTPADKSVVPTNLRPLDPMVKLTNFNNTLNITPTKVRQLLLNEVATADGPLEVLVNNNRFKSDPPDLYFPAQMGDPTEIPTEGTTEVWQIINTTADAHPIHPHLVQWQLVSRQTFNVDAYLAAYSAAWVPRGLPNFPSFLSYPGGSGSPFPYDSVNTDGAIGGNPSVSPFLIGSPMVVPPEERGWKDSFKAFPGEVSTYICRVAPTDKPINTPSYQLIFPFDPSAGPGYVWHCHIIDHEDMDMMRPNPISISPGRFPTITGPASVCQGSRMNVYTTEPGMTNYIWEVSSGGNIQAGGTSIDNTVTVRWNTVGAQTVSVNYTGIYGYIPQSPTLFDVTVSPLPVPTITGPLTVSVGTTNTYTTEAGMSGYSWSITGSGYSILSGQGTNSINVKFTSIGNKTVRVTYANSFGCNPLNPTALNVKVVKPKDMVAEGINDNNLIPTFDVYPSPNQGQFTAAINSPVDDLYSIQVYNSVGVRIYEVQNVRVSGKSETRIDISPAPFGLYTVVFMNNQSQTVRKFLVSR